VGKKNRKSQIKVGTVITILFCLLLVISTVLGRLPSVILIFYALMSVITFITYAIDKSAAKKGQWRTKESTLHLLSLIGGWPGGYYAQNHLRHKSSKTSFKTVFWITAAINSMVIVYALTDPDPQVLNYIFALTK